MKLWQIRGYAICALVVCAFALPTWAENAKHGHAAEATAGPAADTHKKTTSSHAAEADVDSEDASSAHGHEAPAAQNGRIYFLSGDYLLIPGPRMGKVAEDFVKVLHP